MVDKNTFGQEPGNGAVDSSIDIQTPGLQLH